MKRILVYVFLASLLFVEGLHSSLQRNMDQTFSDDQPQVLLDVDNNLDLLQDEMKKVSTDDQLVAEPKTLWAGFKKNIKDPSQLNNVANQFNTALTSTVTSFKSGNAAGGIGAMLKFGGTIAAVVPGGQPVALALGLVGTIVGLFSPTKAKVPTTPPITIDQIKDAMKTELWEHELDDYKDIKIPAAGEALFAQLTHMMDVMNSPPANASRLVDSYIDHWLSVFNGVLTDVTQTTGEGWNVYQQTISQYAAKQPQNRRCVNTCFLMVSLLDSWKQNPADPNYQSLTSPDWDISRHGDTKNDDDRTPSEDEQNVRFKLCYFHYVRNYEDGGRAINYLDPDCSNRVYNIDTCSQEVRDSTNDFTGVKGLYDSLSSLANLEILTITTLQRLLLLSENMSLDEQKMSIEGYSEMIAADTWKAFKWDVNKVNDFEMDGSNYTCTDTSYPWLSHAGDVGYDNTRLNDAPCAYQLYCDQTSDDMAVCNDPAYHCSDFNAGEFMYPPKSKVNYNWIGPTYSYDKGVGESYLESSHALDISSALYAVPK